MNTTLSSIHHQQATTSSVTNVFARASRHRLNVLLLIVGSLAAAGCAVSTDDSTAPSTTTQAQQATQPLIGATEAKDAADRDCQVILRSLARPKAQGGYETETIDGRQWFVWDGQVDVASDVLPDVASVAVMYRTSVTGPWWRSEEQGTDQAVERGDFGRFQVHIAEHTVSPGMSMTSLMRTRLQVIPVLTMRDGSRRFDHNRHPDDFDNYVLSADNEWSVQQDGTCATTTPAEPTRASVAFQTGWTQQQHGAIVAGGQLEVTYDLDRLPECRNTHNGYPAWGLRGFARFEPGGQLFEGSLVGFENHNGVPTPNAFSIPWTISVPQDARRVEMWFLNESGAGSSCKRWDSHFEQNYAFDVRQEAPNQVVWAGDWGSCVDRSCGRADGVEDPMRINSYRYQRACVFVDAEVYAPGITDSNIDNPAAMMAQVQWKTKEGLSKTEWLQPKGRVGNNLRYRWTVPIHGDLDHTSWSKLQYTFRFSTDGATWTVLGRDDGSPRVIEQAYMSD